MARKLILYIAMSLDGYIARDNGDIDWLVGDGSQPNIDNGYTQFLSSIDTVILGNKTYEQIMSWGEYPYKGLTSYVYTNQSLSNTEDVMFTNLPPKQLIEQLKTTKGKDIWLVGGAEIIKYFMKENLIDEYIIAVTPTLIGSGIPLFHEKTYSDIRLQLKETKTFDGFVQNHYIKLDN